MTCIVLGYGQASLDPTVPSTAEQETHLEEACATLIKAGNLPADAKWAGFVREYATDKPTRFRQRHGGSCLLASLTANHVVMALRHDIIFSSVVDFSETLELLQLLRFRLIVLDCGLDISPNAQLTPIALAMKSLRQRERKRTKEEFEVRKRNGMPAGGRCPIGWEIVRAGRGAQDRAYFVPDHGARRLGKFIVEHREQWASTRAGTFEQTAQWLNSQKIPRPDGKPWRK